MSEECLVGTAGAVWSSRAAELDDLRRQGLWLPGPAAALEVLGQTGLERAHQAYIAWLLNPRGSHGFGAQVLINLEHHCGSEELSTRQLSAALVKIEDARAQSRADIVVSMPEHTLVIELKVHSGEGDEQTRRLADDHAKSPSPLFVFLTLNGDQPLDARFKPMFLKNLAACIRAALRDAPLPRNQAEERGRATAVDYVYALERKCGVEPINQHAALFWLRNGPDMDAAKSEAVRLLKMLPDQIAADLASLAQEIGDNLQVARIDYIARGKYGAYPEVALLLHRPQWCGAEGQPRFGIGAGQRTRDVNPFDRDKSPFFGVWAEDPVARADLGDGEWHNWAWWSPVDLEPPCNGEDLLSWYSSVAMRDVRRTWHESWETIDKLAKQTVS
jgi:hypothetical protein